MEAMSFFAIAAFLMAASLNGTVKTFGRKLRNLSRAEEGADWEWKYESIKAYNI